MNTPSPNPLPLKGREGFFCLSRLPEGEGLVRALFVIFGLVPRLRGENGYCSSKTAPSCIIARRIAPKQPRGTSP